MKFFKKSKKNLKIKKGDDQAFVSLYDYYALPIYRFIYLRTNSSQDSEDLTSEVFLRFWRNLSDTEFVGNPRALLYQIARNLVVDFYRKKVKKEIIIGKEEEDFLKNIPDNMNLKEKADLASDVRQIKKALDKVKGEHQELLIWHYLDDFSVKEISQILEVPENRIRVKIHRALKDLKNKL